MLQDAISRASQSPQIEGTGDRGGYGESAAQKREARLTEYEKKLNEVMEAQKIVQQKLDKSVKERAEAEKRSEDRQAKIMELLQLLTNKPM